MSAKHHEQILVKFRKIPKQTRDDVDRVRRGDGDLKEGTRGELEVTLKAAGAQIDSELDLAGLSALKFGSQDFGH